MLIEKIGEGGCGHDVQNQIFKQWSFLFQESCQVSFLANCLCICVNVTNLELISLPIRHSSKLHQSYKLFIAGI